MAVTDIIANLVSRRSVAKFTGQSVAPELIKEIIEIGTFAPCHKRTDPWRFTVFTGDGRKALACAMANGFASANSGFDGYEVNLEKVKRKAFRAPAIIAVWCAVGRGKINPPAWEDEAATSACLQNMSLAAHALGLGAIWRTSAPVTWPEVQALCKTDDDELDIDKGDKIIGFLYIGHIDKNYPEPNRTPEPAKIKYYSN